MSQTSRTSHISHTSLIKVALIDFEDSFTYNIYSELSLMAFDVEVYHFRDSIDYKSYDVLLLGPGPGHPLEYLDEVREHINAAIENKLQLRGICLGHQILCLYFGLQVISSENIIHGSYEELSLNSFWKKFFQIERPIQIQRYNSLTVKPLAKGEIGEVKQLLSKTNEMMAIIHSKFISYQFHPESIGTNCRKQFFGALLRIYP